MQYLTSRDTLQRIWDAHQLGPIHSVRIPASGVMNTARVVNETHVIRFDVLDYEGISRYQGEKMAYERLRASDVPVPEVTALDLSKTLAPYGYIILTKLAGVPLADVWNDLSASQKSRIALDTGRYLALIHDETLERFGALQNLGQSPFSSWYQRLMSQVEGDTDEAVALGLLAISVAQKIRTIFENHQHLLEIGSSGRLVHGDFQFENVLYHYAKITGIIDFEWANSGDPAWDFRFVELWQQQCPGIREQIYEGYSRVKPFESDHALRVRLYKMLQYVNEILFYGQDQPDPVKSRHYLTLLMETFDLFS